LQVTSTFHRLLAPFEDLQPGEERQEQVSAAGRVVVKRLLGRRLAFFDLQSLAPGEDAVLQLRFILPAWQGGPVSTTAASDHQHVQGEDGAASAASSEEREKEREQSFWWATKNVKPGDIVGAHTSRWHATCMCVCVCVVTMTG
jgi:lysyl-tRNA synthetase class II